jgi:hypothetical protein
MTTGWRALLAIGAAIVLAVAATGYVLAVRDRAAGDAGSPGITLAAGPRIAFVSTASGSQGRVSTVPLANPAGPRSAADISCDRLYAAAGTGICLRRDGLLATYQLAVLDERLRVTRGIPIVGLPTRARVSADGTMLAWTVFVTGDSYNGGAFSTRAGILNRVSGELIATLEDFSVTVDGRPYRAVDENFWGVTFAGDDNTFYATMSSRGHRYLVAGDIATRTVRVLADNVECPSLSPDGTRIAYKQAIEGDPSRGWRLAIRDLKTGGVTPLGEHRSIDDQAAWLDGATVMYSVPRGTGGSDVWSVPADGTGAPRLLIPDAISPAAL